MSSTSTSSFEIEWPDVSYDKGDQEFYSSLVAKDSSSIFKGKERIDVFMYAMALGFKVGKRLPLVKKLPNINPSAVSGERRWLMRSVAVVETQELNTIIDHKLVAKIAEEFANAGIHIVHEMEEKSIAASEREEEYQTELYEQIKKIGLGKAKSEDSDNEK